MGGKRGCLCLYVCVCERAEVVFCMYCSAVTTADPTSATFNTTNSSAASPTTSNSDRTSNTTAAAAATTDTTCGSSITAIVLKVFVT